MLGVHGIHLLAAQGSQRILPRCCRKSVLATSPVQRTLTLTRSRAWLTNAGSILHLRWELVGHIEGSMDLLQAGTACCGLLTQSSRKRWDCMRFLMSLLARFATPCTPRLGRHSRLHSPFLADICLWHSCCSPGNGATVITQLSLRNR